MTRTLIKFKKQSSILIAAAVMMSSQVFANSPFYPIPFFQPPALSVWGCWLRPVVAVGTGAAITTNLDHSQTFPIINEETDQFYIYHGDSSSQTQAFIDAFLGVEWGFHPNWAVQLGLGYHRPNEFKVRGTFIQGADVQSQDVFRYRYDVTVNQFLVEGKLLYTFDCIFHPYVMGGLGVASNRADDFHTNVPPFLTFTRVYNSHTERSFSYNVGIGIDFDVHPNIRLGVGYRFADFGEIKLGKARIDTTPVPGTLKQDHLHANEIIGQITFIL